MDKEIFETKAELGFNRWYAEVEWELKKAVRSAYFRGLADGIELSKEIIDERSD